PDSLRTRLVAAISRRDRDEVVKLTQDPSFQDLPPATLVVLAKQEIELEEHAAAAVLLRAGLERQPGDFWMNLELGFVLGHPKLGGGGGALRYLTAAVALRPDSPNAHLFLGMALQDKGDVEGAIRRYRAALHINPRYAEAHRRLGEFLVDKGLLK